ncbi:FAD-dependent oxidoreductase [Actinotalea sp. C106]|uniref:FAD-dependent oxidoreductase n=1 Tax=Actinotalea sp. C106 TaxID=2908644 RepID=UPI0020277B5D|nr:FAD-dependent oxidoreductase [Actinotalea sp. C106]
MRAVVCGAGIAGLSVAWWLRGDGWDVTLVEQAPRPRGAGYMIDFFGPGFEVAERMGLLPELRRRAATITSVQYVDPAGRRRGRADYTAFRDAADGRLLSLPRGALAEVLHEAVVERIDLRRGLTVDSATEQADGVHVRLSDGTTTTADLLVGADGLHSRVRDLAVAPDREAVQSLGYQTAAYLLRDDALRRLVGRRLLLVAVPDRQVALYPMDDEHLAAWLVHRDHGPVPPDPRAAVLSRYAGLGPVVDRALTHLTPGTDLYYDDVAQTHLTRWTQGRAVLVGDAAYAPSLMAGQGASLAMTGAWALAGALARHPGDVPTALRRYTETMRPFVEDRQASGRRTARWLVPSTAWQIRLRQLVLAVTALPGTTPVIRRALGTQIDAALPG